MTKFRILFLATRDWYHPGAAGGDIVMWEFARYLSSIGHETTFVAASFHGASREDFLDGINVIRLGRVSTLWLRTFLFYMSRGRGRFDVVVAEGFGGARIPRMAPLYVREPMIIEWHQVHRRLFAVQYPAVLRGPLNLLERLTAIVNRGSMVRANTIELQRELPKIGFRPDRLFVVPVSVRDEWLAEPNGDSGRESTILWLGKFRRYKCPHHAILAMKEVVARVPNARLILAGRHDDRKYEREMMRLVERLGLSPNIEFRFDLSESEKHELLKRTKVLVLPSAVEGFGIVVLEANACGVPVLASNGVPEAAVRDGYNGLRYPFGDKVALANAIVYSLTDEKGYRDMSDNALHFAREFSWRDVGARYARVVEKVAGNVARYR